MDLSGKLYAEPGAGARARETEQRDNREALQKGTVESRLLQVQSDSTALCLGPRRQQLLPLADHLGPFLLRHGQHGFGPRRQLLEDERAGA